MLQLKDFNNLSEANQTTVAFKHLMAKAWKECHHDNLTNAGTGGHHGANTATMKEDKEVATQAHINALASQVYQDREHTSAAINASVCQACADHAE